MAKYAVQFNTDKPLKEFIFESVERQLLLETLNRVTCFKIFCKCLNKNYALTSISVPKRVVSLFPQKLVLLKAFHAQLSKILILC